MGTDKVVRLTLLRWNTVVNINGPLGRRMKGVYIRQSIALHGEAEPEPMTLTYTPEGIPVYER